jgi:hypothetical protein
MQNERGLAAYGALPKLAQERHMRLVVSNEA